MKRKLGNADRIIRIVAAVTIAAFYLLNVITGPVAYILLALAGIFVLTGFVGVCPLYSVFKINTHDIKNKKSLSATGKR